jgi:hypothetical protein
MKVIHNLKEVFFPLSVEVAKECCGVNRKINNLFTWDSNFSFFAATLMRLSQMQMAFVQKKTLLSQRKNCLIKYGCNLIYFFIRWKTFSITIFFRKKICHAFE